MAKVMPDNRGKRINRTSVGSRNVSRNGVKHGLSATKPPTLITEDSDVYHERLEELTDEWQPATPTERFYVENIAFNQWKIYRARKCETARANNEIMQERRANTALNFGLREVVKPELEALEKLNHSLSLSLEPDEKRSEQETVEGVIAALADVDFAAIRTKEVRGALQLFHQGLQETGDPRLAVDGGFVVLTHAKSLLKATQKECELLSGIRDDLKAVVTDPDNLDRHVVRINRQIKEDIDMLQSLQRSRREGLRKV